MNGEKTVRKNVNFPFEIIARIGSLSEELNTNFSSFVREATKERIEKIEQERLEIKLAEGYTAMAEEHKQFAKLSAKVAAEVVPAWK